MRNPITEILEELYPYSPNSNARKIVRNKLESFERSPSISKAQELESFGIPVDYDMVSTGEDMNLEENQ